ncbi:N(6)-adenine-specific methyltransferase METTL4 isoform X2 [Protopterus annectens]|uniref:N(6)-adenine-specific methyltransferase METTL4 isoform X2 n=1 Tax=Protopterus annectens TaxID=7888 RepID=UPI001CF96A00|nr:N(6)-adenine-specific methyltransferase METTL4 isoform X2 [Protopterus annectens]
MAVVHRGSNGWMLDHLTYINKTILNCERMKSYTFRPEYFDIVKPHISSSTKTTNPLLKTKTSSTKESTEVSCSGDETISQDIQGNTACYSRVRDLILEGTKCLLQSEMTKSLLPRMNASNGDHNSCLANMITSDSRLAELCELAKQVPLEDKEVEDGQSAVQVIDEETQSVPDLDPFSLVTENIMNCTRIVTLMGEKYLLPPHTSFLLSDITRMRPLLNYKKFDAIVIDPPWENKSVKRSNRYSYLQSWQIKQIPIPALASPECLVATWVTNRQKHLRFVKEELYPHWAIDLVAEWYWVKITRSFEFVYPLDSPHKKPYEILILGKVKSSAYCQNREETEPIPDQQLLVSVPSKLHSHKPSLAEVLAGYIRSNAHCLELFARSLQPGWTSWGNEVLKFQHLDYFCSVEDVT